MQFIKNNIWGIGFAVILIGALAAMALASKNSKLPSSSGTAKATVDFQINADDNVRGSSSAKVTLVEFGDFQCPACAAYFPLVEQLSKEFPNDLRLVFRHFPLTTIHFQALNAAHASEAAAIQGKFWEMYSELYQTQQSWPTIPGVDVFAEHATKIPGIDIAKFKTDMGSGAVKDRVNKDIDFGNSIGINSTPTFYLNGVKISNPQSYNEFKALVTSAIASSTASAPTLTP